MPLSRGWRIMSIVVGALIVAGVAAIISVSQRDDGENGPTVRSVAVDAGTTGQRVVESVSIEEDPATPGAVRLRVEGDDVDRVDIAGDALCRPARGAGGGWIAIDLCGELDRITITARDGDDEITTVTVEL